MYAMRIGTAALAAVICGILAAPASAQDQKETASSPSKKELIQKMDPGMKAVVQKMEELGIQPLHKLTPEQARKQPTAADAVKAVMKEQGKKPEKDELAQVKDITVQGAEGKLPARIYKPTGEAPMPVILYFHGGGWVVGSIDAFDASARALAKGANAIVISADYRRAPEHKFPAAHQDAFAVYQWVLDHIDEYGGDPERVAVAGESAGGNLAANVAIMARDKGVTEPVHQLLVYPVANTDMTTESYQENANAVPLGKKTMAWFVKHVFENKNQANDPRIRLVNADLKGLPPATIILAEIDPLRSEGRMLAEQFEKAGVDVTVKTYDGVAHLFFGMAPVVKDAKPAQKLATTELQQDLAGKPKREASR